MVITIYIWHTYDMPSYKCVQQYTMYAVKYMNTQQYVITTYLAARFQICTYLASLHGQAWFQILANGSSRKFCGRMPGASGHWAVAGKAWLRTVFFGIGKVVDETKKMEDSRKRKIKRGLCLNDFKWIYVC